MIIGIDGITKKNSVSLKRAQVQNIIIPNPQNLKFTNGLSMILQLETKLKS